MKRTIPFLLNLAVLTLSLVTPSSAQDIVERMEREHAGDRPIPNPMSQAAPALAVTGEEVTYAESDGTPVRGYLARPSNAETGAAIIVIHEWWGLNDNIRAMAERLAGEGFTALAIDLYEGKVAADRETAAGLMRGTLERGAALTDNIRQAHRYLTDRAGAQRIGVIGWCFGGGWSLRTALALGDRIDAAVIYYGRLLTEREELVALSAPVLGHFGELDRGIPLETVRAFEAAMAALDKEAEIRIYPDADHAFANPSGTRFNEEAATDAWARTIDFLRSHLQ